LLGQAVRGGVEAVARLPAAVSTPWRSDKSEASVESWLTLSKKLEISVPISLVLLVKLTAPAAGPKPAR